MSLRTLTWCFITFVLRTLRGLTLILLICFSPMILILASSILFRLYRIRQAPPGLPWLGVDSKLALCKLWACLRNPIDQQKGFEDGYSAYSKRQRPYILPTIPWYTVVLPPDHARWISSQPNSVLCTRDLIEETTGAQYFAGAPEGLNTIDSMGVLLRKDLTRETVRLTGPMLDEIEYAFDKELGHLHLEGWHEVSAGKLLQHVTCQVVNRVCVGISLSRNPNYENHLTYWTTACGICALFMAFLIPPPIRPFVMWMFAIPLHLLHWWTGGELRRTIQRRIEILQTTGWEFGQKPNDMLQWVIEANASKSIEGVLDPAYIARSVVLQNFLPRTTILPVINMVLLNILKHEQAHDLVQELRCEAKECLSSLNGDMSLRKEDMAKMDSAIRETLRLDPIFADALTRKVVAPGGVCTPDGTHLPCGTYVQTSVRFMQRDTDRFGPGADKFEPLRHYQRSTAPQTSASEPEHRSVDRGFATRPSEDYLSFGLGSHACPGRVFAVQAMKLVLGYFLLNYELRLPSQSKLKDDVSRISVSTVLGHDVVEIRRLEKR